MTENEAIDWIRSLKDSDNVQEFYYAENFIDAFGIAIKALEKQIPKNLIDIVDETFGDTHTVCPNCKSGALVNPYRAGREGYPYCPWCGQKLNWDEPYKRLERE